MKNRDKMSNYAQTHWTILDDSNKRLLKKLKTQILPRLLFPTRESVVDADEGWDDEHDGQDHVVGDPQDFFCMLNANNNKIFWN